MNLLRKVKHCDIHERVERRLMARGEAQGAVPAHHPVIPGLGVNVATVNERPHRGPDDPIVHKVELLVEHVAHITGSPAAALILDVEIGEASLRDGVQQRGNIRGPETAHREVLGRLR